MDKLRLFYESSGVNYDSVLRRLGNKEALLRKCLLKFTEDKNFERLQEAVAQEDKESLLMAAHTLKGVSANLDLRLLCALTSEIVVCLREEKMERIPTLFIQTKEEYNRIISELKILL